MIDGNEQAEALVDELMRRLEPFLKPAPEPDADYLTLAEVSRRTSFSYDFIYDAVRDGQLPAIQKGREWRVAVADMRAWMDKDRAGVLRPSRSQMTAKVSRLMPGLSR